ncbi:hypothetical protein PJP13_29745, partial [Mycobacterium kansasii]
MSPKRKNTPPVFVKGESSNSKGKNTYQGFSRNSKVIQKPKSGHINFYQKQNPLAEKIVDLLKELLKS